MTIDPFLFIPPALSFLVIILLMPFWIRKMNQLGLSWKDMNKFKDIKVPGSGGVIVILGFIIGVFSYIAYNVFLFEVSDGFLLSIFAIISALIILAGIGFIDDFFGWQRGGMSRRSRIILVGIAAIPLMAINAGKSSIGLPFFGELELGLIYPLFLIPLGMIGATTTFNFLAGFNGLESGQGVIILSSLALVAYLTGNPWLALIALIMVVSLLAFLIFNYCPAKVFPGDSLTYSIGGLIAIMAIVGNFEKVAFLIFTPYIIETILKSTGKLKKHSFGLPKKDGSLDLRYSRIYGMTHLSIYILKKLNIKPTERKVVSLIWIFQIIVIIISFCIFRDTIF